MSRAIGIINTSVGSANIGDQIIMDSCMKEIIRLRPMDHLIHFSSHDPWLLHSLNIQHKYVRKNILCGTNCVGSRMFWRPAWGVNLLTAQFIKPVTSIGIGWGGYQGRPDAYTRMLLRKLFGGSGSISVRDSYTKEKLEGCGLNDVVNTGCASIWSLTPEHCRNIRSKKAENVVYTLTDYAENFVQDLECLIRLQKAYGHVYVWIQGGNDGDYLERLQHKINMQTGTRSSISVIPPSLAAFDGFLESTDVDYIGTRLHGGIRALQKGRRTLILAVDNRAIEMGKDFNLPVIAREKFEELPALIESDRSTEIILPVKIIEDFRNSLIAM